MESYYEHQDYGNKFEYDPDFQGPTRDRYVTDKGFCYAYLVFVILWCVGGGYAMFKGDIAPLNKDSMSFVQNKCGFDPAASEKPNVLYFDVRQCSRTKECATQSVCVTTCPDETFIFNAAQCTAENLEETKGKLRCQDSVDIESLADCAQVADVMASTANCIPWYFASKLVSRRCVPTTWTTADLELIGVTEGDMRHGANGLSMFASEAMKELRKEIISDVGKSWISIVVSILVGIVLSVVMILLLRWLAGPIVWATIVFIVVILACFMFLARGNIIFMVILGVILIVILVVVFCLRHKIMAAIVMVEVCSGALTTIPMSIFFPFLPCVFELATFAFMIFAMLSLSSLYEKTYTVSQLASDTACTCTGDAAGYQDGATCELETFISNCANCMRATCKETVNVPAYVLGLMILNVVGTLWITFFLNGISDIVLAFTFGTWYWTWEKRDVPSGILTLAFRVAITFHLGTVAFGALILTIVEIVRMILDSIRDRLMDSESPAAAACMTAFICIYECIQQIIGFITHNAYIICGLHGTPFCASTKTAFSLIMRNILNFLTISKVTDIIFCISKTMVACAVGALLYLFWTNSSTKLNHITVPVIMGMMGTFFVSSIFFRVYSTAVDTIFICFLEDTERNDGSPERPYYVCDDRMWQILGVRGRL